MGMLIANVNRCKRLKRMLDRGALLVKEEGKKGKKGAAKLDTLSSKKKEKVTKVKGPGPKSKKRKIQSLESSDSDSDSEKEGEKAVRWIKKKGRTAVEEEEEEEEMSIRRRMVRRRISSTIRSGPWDAFRGVRLVGSSIFWTSSGLVSYCLYVTVNYLLT
ncbi:hypothetical protein BZA05DRAFT_42517 [Tricharina praecox]|uniref:uncharacterized protein n=1 Tax=Tricharina praecox TaxID=43433 RepID=UPI00221FD617|nr:uncharacterized protein BZA05DRAFT_42517 [Tricharina praecox]KAI5852357.1 hypothetical protein BZA05DRAFT_42517 [Tricharina praecox]